MFVTRLVAATVGTIALVVVVFYATQPPPRQVAESGPAWPSQPARPVSSKALFLEHCARCHGENGNGAGTTELERPARSFMAGGYAYGNTLQAVMRTLEYGIPGTAMPAFGESLTVQQRSSLARFVLALGPKPTPVRSGAGRLAVEDRPLLVQGMVGAYGGVDASEPRSLVIGFPNGATFHYRATDLQLLAMLQGDFVDRSDWKGRGGEPLRLLGEPVWTRSAASDRAATFERASDGGPLRRRLARSSTQRGEVVLTYDLVDAESSRVGAGEERISCVEAGGKTVAVRTQRLTEGGSAVRLTGIERSDRAGAFDLRQVDEGLQLARPAGRSDTRLFIHAPGWTDALGAAVEKALQRLP